MPSFLVAGTLCAYLHGNAKFDIWPATLDESFKSGALGAFWSSAANQSLFARPCSALLRLCISKQRAELGTLE